MYPVVLIGGDGNEAGLWKDECLEVPCPGKVLVVISFYIDDV